MKHLEAEPPFTDRQERRLLRAAAAAIRSEFPNPERRDCPPTRAVSQLARRRIPLPQTAELVDHVATCAPCFAAYKRYRWRIRVAQLAGPTLTAALILLGLMLALRNRSAHNSVSPPQIVHAPVAPVLEASIDYREISPTRSGDEQARPARVPSLRRGLFRLTILLPFGAEDGEYEIEIRDPGGDSLLRTSGVAHWNGAAEALTTKLDLHQLFAGRYIVALRKGGESWRTYPLIMEQDK